MTRRRRDAARWRRRATSRTWRPTAEEARGASCAKRTWARPSRDDRAGTPGLPAGGPARRARRHRAPVRDPRRDDPAPRRPAPRRADRRPACKIIAHEPRRARRREFTTAIAGTLLALPPGHRDPDDGRDPRGGPARASTSRRGKPVDAGDRAGGRAAHATTTSWTSATLAGRGDLARGADRAAVRGDCPGLCVECGERLGPGHVEHEDDEIDPRLAALQAFRVDGDGESG